jgi:hypothetical protein
VSNSSTGADKHHDTVARELHRSHRPATAAAPTVKMRSSTGVVHAAHKSTGWYVTACTGRSLTGMCTDELVTCKACVNKDSGCDGYDAVFDEVFGASQRVKTETSIDYDALKKKYRHLGDYVAIAHVSPTGTVLTPTKSGRHPTSPVSFTRHGSISLTARTNANRSVPHCGTVQRKSVGLLNETFQCR